MSERGDWLISAKDADGRTIYYAGAGAFVDDPAWAVKFPTKKAAELRSFGLADFHGVETVEILS